MAGDIEVVDLLDSSEDEHDDIREVQVDRQVRQASPAGQRADEEDDEIVVTGAFFHRRVGTPHARRRARAADSLTSRIDSFVSSRMRKPDPSRLRPETLARWPVAASSDASTGDLESRVSQR